MSREVWQTREGWDVGYLGKERDKVHQELDLQLGRGQWRFAWRLANGVILDYAGIFYEDFVDGYVKHFLTHPNEAQLLTDKFSYIYDKNLITREEAFDRDAYYQRPGFDNQIHHAA